MNFALPWHNYRPWLFAGVIALHLFALHWLFNDSPSNGIRGHVNKPSNDVVLILDFIESKKTVKKRPMTLVPRSPNHSSELHAAVSNMPTSMSSTADSPSPKEQDRALKLNLSLPSELTVFVSPNANPLDHQSALEYQATIFDKAWVPAGTVGDSVLYHSAVARGVLSILGAKRPCTEAQKRRRDQRCFPDQFRE